MKIILDLDDLSPVKPGIELLQKVKQHYPNFKVTCFTPALDQAFIKGELKEEKLKEWAKIIKEMDWIEIAPHGFLHMKEEMITDYETASELIKSAESIFKKIELPYVKIWKSPYWQTSEEAYRAIKDKGYIVAIDKKQTTPKEYKLKEYKFDQSIHEDLPKDKDIVKYHGHIGGTFYNDISLCMDKLLQMPENAEFLTISEYLNESN